jgi:hypothetical protein
MIAEAPSPSCDTVAAPRDARDYDYDQTGVAPNAIELHPILGFRCLS